MVGANITFDSGRRVTLYGDWKGQLKELQAQGYGNVVGLNAFSGTGSGSQEGSVIARTGIVNTPEGVRQSPSYQLTRITPTSPAPEQAGATANIKDMSVVESNKIPETLSRKQPLNIKQSDYYSELTGISMQPTAYTGDKFLLKKYKGEDLPIGTMIRFKNPNEPLGYTIHRVVNKAGDDYVTIGENREGVGNNFEFVKKKDIVGIAVGLESNKYQKTFANLSNLTGAEVDKIVSKKEEPPKVDNIFIPKLRNPMVYNAPKPQGTEKAGATEYPFYKNVEYAGSIKGQTAIDLQPKGLTQRVFVGYDKDYSGNFKPVYKDVPAGYNLITSPPPTSMIQPTEVTSIQLMTGEVRNILSPSTTFTETVTTLPKVTELGFKSVGEQVGKEIVGKGKTINITPKKIPTRPTQQGTTITGILGESAPTFIKDTGTPIQQTVTITPTTFGEVSNVGSYFLPYVGTTRLAVDWLGAGTKVATGQKTTFGEKATLIGGLGYGVFKLGEPSYNYFITTKVRPALEKKNELNLLGFTGNVVERVPTETENVFYANYRARVSYKGKVYDRTIFGDIQVPTNQPIQDKVISGSKFRIFERIEGGEPEVEPLLRSSALTTSERLPPPASEDIFFSSSRIVTIKPSGEKVFTKAEGLTTKGVRPDVRNNLRILSGETAEGQSIEFFTDVGIAKNLKPFEVTPSKESIFGKTLKNIFKPTKEVKLTPSQLEEGGTFSLGFTKLKRYQEPQESMFGNIFGDLVIKKKVQSPVLSSEEIKSLIEPTIKNQFKVRNIKVKSTMVTGGLETTQQKYEPIFYQYQETGGLIPKTIQPNILATPQRQEEKQEQIPKLDLIGIQKEGQKQRQSSGTIGIQSTGQQQKQEEKQKQKEKQQEVQQQKERQREVQKLRNLLVTTTPFPRITTPPHTPRIIIPTTSTMKLKSLLGKISTEKGYQAYVKRFGKFTPIGKITTKGEAIKLGVKATKRSLAATFKVTPTNRQITSFKDLMYTPPSKEFRGYRVIKGVKIPLEETWIQKAPFRLSSRSEVQEIKQARKSNIFKKGRFKW